MFFGFLLLVFPNTSVFTTARIFGAFLIIDGIVCFLKYLLLCRLGGASSLWGVYFFTFLLDFAVGITSVAHPSITTQILIIAAAVWFLLVGLMELFVACILRSGMGATSCGCMAMGGILYVIFAIVLFADPARGVSAISRIAGVMILLFGLEMTCFAEQLRKKFKNAESSMSSFGQHNPDAPVV
jgi:uncharacterized membrane protein HdeD (DUF308 family)